jgi:hypothetical protein
MAAERFGVFFTNFGYGAIETFATAEQAIAHGKKCGFECSIVVYNRSGPQGEVIGAWSPIGGYREFLPA